MSIRLALLLSLLLHAALVLGPAWFAVAPPPAAPRIEARLLPVDEPAPLAPRTATDAPASPSSPPRVPAPRRLGGAELARTQAELVRHLFYPPEAVARGLEGETTLLLTTDGEGRLIRVELARSSGHKLLDDAALDAARRLGRLAGPPRQLLFPVSFRLQ